MHNGPPFDGKPCPMCPVEVRNLHAVAHNLALRAQGRSSSSDTSIEDLEQAVAHVTSHASESRSEILSLRTASQRFVESVRSFKRPSTPDLWAAVEAAQPMVDAHFADSMHSHGYTQRAAGNC